ncbi:MAG: putative collagen-binding domain-containing protein [Opitutus sp.]
MDNADDLLGNGIGGESAYCLRKKDEVYLIYLPSGGGCTIDLRETSGAFNVHWFNPRAGGPLIETDTKQITAGARVRLGSPASQPDEDWAILLRR